MSTGSCKGAAVAGGCLSARWVQRTLALFPTPCRADVVLQRKEKGHEILKAEERVDTESTFPVRGVMTNQTLSCDFYRELCTAVLL